VQESSETRRYIVIDQVSTARDVARLARGHRGIESGLHWSLDVVGRGSLRWPWDDTRRSQAPEHGGQQRLAVKPCNKLKSTEKKTAIGCHWLALSCRARNTAAHPLRSWRRRRQDGGDVDGPHAF
jgi:hypothetical protein